MISQTRTKTKATIDGKIFILKKYYNLKKKMNEMNFIYFFFQTTNDQERSYISSSRR